MWGRWAALGLYTLALYALLPIGPRLGLAALRTAPGSWLLGPGLAVLGAAGALALVVRLRRRRAPPWAYLALAGAALAYVVAFSSLRAARLERTHLPEYGVAGILAWRALVPLVPGPAAYVAAAGLGAAIGLGDELLQGVVPGRHWDLRDVGMNALGALLGVIVLAAALSGGSSSRRSPPGAGSSPR